MRRAILSAMSLLGLVLLTACTSTEDTLNPAAMAPEPAPAVSPPTVTTDVAAGDAAADPAAAPGQTAAVASAARVQFAPIVGATVEAVAPLTRQLSATARERGLRLVPGSDPATTHVMKGYFSALSEGSETIVIYVWDVVDPAGNRLHRIQGQERTTGGRGEGWAAVSPETMQAIADRTIDDLISWLAAKPS